MADAGDRTFLILTGAITALLLPTIVFVPTLLLKLAAFAGIVALADDSGIEVDALGGK